MERKRIFRILSCILVAVFTAACSIQGTPVPVEPLFSPTPSLTTTSTIVWFPATATSTPQPTVTPMPAQDLKPGIGSLLFEDNFQNSENWNKQITSNGNVVPGGGELTLAVQSSKGSLTTIRQNTTVSNFYAEATVNASLCKGDDMAGFLFRSASDQSYYRYLVDCNGRVSAQVVIGTAPTPMRDWVSSSQLQPGLPYKFTMGVWAYGNVMRFFINGEMQFEITRDLYRSGGLGFYARAAGDSPLTMNFSQLKVYEVQLSAPLVSPTPTPSLTPALGS